jgi:hypothetical protein
LTDYGWVWVPGRDADLEWGPAWVSWRTGGDYVGWAPLPPETIAVVESRPLTGHLDVEFNIGPACYNFVDVRYIGEPVLRERIIAPGQNVTYIQETVNVTNITYKNKTVYNYGPDINVINRSSTRPIQRLRLDREQNVDVAAAVKSGGLTKVQGDRLIVASPMRINRSAGQIAPPAVKTKVASAKIDRGWGGVGDEKAQAEFKERIKTQNLKNVSPPTNAGAAGQANAAAGTSPGGAAGAATDMNQNRGAGHRDGRADAATAAGASPTRQDLPASAAAPPTMGAGPEAGSAQGSVGGHHGRQGQEGQNLPGSNAGPNPGSATTDSSQQGPAEGRRAQRRAMQNNPAGQDFGPGQGSGGQGQRERQLHAQPGQPGPAETQGQGTTGGHHQQGPAQDGGQGAQGEQPQGHGQVHQGGKKGEGSPAPTPQ